MNNKLFHHMQEQLSPGPETLAKLEERLAEAGTVKAAARPRWGRYVALAACAALVIAAVPVYSALNPPLHAYALGAEEAPRRELGLMTGDTGNGIDGTRPLSPGGAAIVERPVQEEATAAYQALMARFAADYGPGSYPGWYGGAYIDDWGGLIVCVVEAPVDDKSLYLEIQDMCGGHSVGFWDVTYPLTHLNALQEQVVELMQGLDFADQLWVSGVDEEHNRLSVTLPFASKKALAGLHRLDPAGDAISVTVTERTAVSVTVPEEPTGYPIAPDSSTQITPEPREELPAPEPAGVSHAPAHYDREQALPAELPAKLPLAEEKPAQTSTAPDVAATVTVPPVEEPAGEPIALEPALVEPGPEHDPPAVATPAAELPGGAYTRD